MIAWKEDLAIIPQSMRVMETTMWTLTLNDGSTLTVRHASSGVNTYQLTDGTWTYNASTKSWAQA